MTKKNTAPTPATKEQESQQNNSAAEKQVPAQNSISHSERFTNAVIREFSANAGGTLELSPFQKKLCQNYFIKIDMVLKEAEAKRLKKDERYREAVSYSWENVNMQQLAVDVIIFSSVGLDPTQPNHLSLIPLKQGTTNKYQINFRMGYRGIELKAKKYGLDVPDEIVVELIYEKDSFRAIKKDRNNEIETYDFEQSEDLDRGEIVGGFYYHSFLSNPKKNKIKTFSRREIDKRKPDNASSEFWGGEKTVWKDGKAAGTEIIEGWYDEMAWKTIYRAAYNAITIDSQKIDANYLSLITRESEQRDDALTERIEQNANKKTMDLDNVEDAHEVVDTVIGQVSQSVADPNPAASGKGQADLFEQNQRPY